MSDPTVPDPDRAAQTRYQVRFGRGADGLRSVGAAADVVVWVDALGSRPVPAGTTSRGVTATVRTRAAAARWAYERQVEAGGRTSIAVIAAGDGAEDTLAAGGVIDGLGDLGIDFTSPEAAVVCAAYTTLRPAIGHLFTAAVEGGALVEAGRRDAVRAAALLDADDDVEEFGGP